MPANSLLATGPSTRQRPPEPRKIDADAAYGCVDWYVYPAEPTERPPGSRNEILRRSSTPAWDQLRAMTGT